MSDPRPPIIPALLAELDRCLAQPLAPWRLYSQWQAQRQLLQRLRDVLSLWPSAGEISSMDQRSQLLAPLQSDVQQLLVQRQALQAEVADLVAARSRQQSQIMAPLIDQVEQLELFQQRTNQVLRDVDGSLQLTFRSLDQDLAAHQRGFAQRLGKLEDLSQQSETIVATLLQQLIQEVQQLQQLALPGAVVPPGLEATGTALPIVPVAASAVDRLESFQPESAPARASVGPSGTPIEQLDELLWLLGLADPVPLPAAPPVDIDEFTLSELPDRFESDAG